MNSNLADLSKEYYAYFWAGVALVEANRRSAVNIIENRLQEISSQIEINGGWIKNIEVNQMTFQPLLQNEQPTRYEIPFVFCKDQNGNTVFFQNLPDPIRRDFIINSLATQ
jgi:hypothetical protein